MEEDLLKYFTGIGTPTTETITPHVVENNSFSTDQLMNLQKTMITNDGTYFIRYGGIREPNQYFVNAIEVYDINAIDNGEILYNFNSIRINNHEVFIYDMHQDEDGRFYALGGYTSGNTNEDYLIIFNNFVQEGQIQIRKYYSNSTMGLPNDYKLEEVVKKEETGDYYITGRTDVDSSNKPAVFHYKIDITLGNSLEVVNYQVQDNIDTAPYGYKKTYIVNDTLVILYLEFKVTEPNNTNYGYYQCQKLTLDTTKELEDGKTTDILIQKNIYVPGWITYFTENYDYIDDYLFKVPYFIWDQTAFYFKFDLIDINGTVKTYSLPNAFTATTSVTEAEISFSTNYCLLDTVYQGSGIVITIKYNPEIANDYITLLGTAGLHTTLLKELNQFDLTMLIGVNTAVTNRVIDYSKITYSEGYTTDEAYYNKNFLIPQYLNLYTDPEDETTLVFSRDISNRFISGNQLSTVYNVPNYLLNNFDITNEKVFGQTTMVIENNLTQIRKNRFESLYLSYLYSIYVIDNTNEDNLTNMEGSNRIADSVWNTLDYMQSPCNKVRVTYEDESQEIKNLEIGDLSNNSYTYTYQVTGNVKKIEYLSQDEQTVYATFRTDLTGTNVIHQTITVEEG